MSAPRSDRELASVLLAAAVELFKRNKAMDQQSAEVAAMFCEMSNVGQADFFGHVARVMATWNGPAATMMQQQYIANAMLECEGGDAAGRDWVRELADRLKEDR